MPETPTPRLQIETIDEVTVAAFTDQRIVDDVVIQAVGDQLYALVDRDGHKKLLLNFGEVQFMASAVIAKLFNLKKRIDAVGGTLKFCCIHPDLRSVFKITGLDRMVPIFDDEQDGIDAF